MESITTTNELISSNKQQQQQTLTLTLTKKELFGILLVDAFRHQLYPYRTTIKKEITEFLTQAFTSMSLSQCILNYLIFDNIVGNGSSSSSSTSSPTLRGQSSPSMTLPQQQEVVDLTSQYLPKINNIWSNVADYLAEVHRDDLIRFRNHFSRLTSSSDRVQSYNNYHSELLHNVVLPSKFNDILASDDYTHVLNQSVETIIIQSIYIDIFPYNFDEDQRLKERIGSLSFIEPSHLDIDRLQHQSPLKKKRFLSKSMIQLISINGDEYLLPMFIYLLLKKNPPNLYSNKMIIELYSNDYHDTSYELFVTTFSLAIQFIEKLDHSHLSIDKATFNRLLKASSSSSTSSSSVGEQLDTAASTSTSTNTSTFTSPTINGATNTTESGLNDQSLENGMITKEHVTSEIKMQLQNIKQYKQVNNHSAIIDTLLQMISKEKHEIEEFMLKLISTSLIAQSYFSTIRSSLKRLFVEFLGVNYTVFCRIEMEVIGSLQDTNEADGAQTPASVGNERGGGLKAAKIAGAAVTGAVIVGLTGGLAAPFVGSVLSAIGAGSLVSGLVSFTGVSGATMLSVIFGAAGAKVSADKMIAATAGIQDYAIHRVKSQTSLHAIIYIDGFAVPPSSTPSATPSQPLETWERMVRRATEDFGDIFLIDYERDNKLKLQSIIAEYQNKLMHTVIKSAATNIISQSLAHALIPLSILKMADVLDNPWTMLKDRSEKAGRILAQQILDGTFGKRPLTLIGTGMGARLVFYCLEELNRLSASDPFATSYVEMAVFIGSPIPCDPKRWSNLSNVVSGRIVNMYSPKDVVLKYICRSAHFFSDGLFPASGVAPIHVPTLSLVIENVDVSCMVKRHLDYEKEGIVKRLLEFAGINKVEYCQPKIPPLFSGIVYHL
ncbi:hypothetical protein SAMD00019534_053190 [Acytostelium subglobosum LB1]|uniref:hypothetical protein n=1 Tax=Acytostelium subglobosum LB1 TaxID=1410327 RepID=UPI0006447C44|nr:hypothetical protein SAMD00019534_053190 [Acytostelium subglobosum LB1]GAM22144.1 hypothetical protein SAMD00019534_053190 [Acytostelium subglobosum LB1]|eukprot:XP_012755244.1 hypothetical protein SAMD00019534_053190 [Acytostelium subglobosum LB1]